MLLTQKVYLHVSFSIDDKFVTTTEYEKRKLWRHALPKNTDQFVFCSNSTLIFPKELSRGVATESIHLANSLLYWPCPYICLVVHVAIPVAIFVPL